MSPNQWVTPAHAEAYLQRPDPLHRGEGEAVLWELVPGSAGRVLDLGTGDGRLLARLRAHCRFEEAVALDVSPTMVDAARRRFAGDPTVSVIEHDMERPLPDLGVFDLVVSAFAIHHLRHERKRELTHEVFGCLVPGGLFANLDHVASPTERLHREFYERMGVPEDPSNRLLDVETQLDWLREAGFDDVDCLWKWRELALMAGIRPG